MPMKKKAAKPLSLAECEASLATIADSVRQHRDAATTEGRKQVLNHVFDMADRAHRALRDDLPQQ